MDNPSTKKSRRLNAGLYSVEMIQEVKKFQQVSFSAAFMKDMRSDADADGRSLAKQIEHYAIIGKNVGGSITSSQLVRIKQGVPLTEVLRGWQADFEGRELSPSETNDWVRAERVFAKQQSSLLNEPALNPQSPVTKPKGRRRESAPTNNKTDDRDGLIGAKAGFPAVAA